MHRQTEDILGELKHSGYKFTGKRKEIVDVFVRHQDKYLTAKDVFTEVKQIYPSMSFDTVYRTLSLLAEKQAIEHLDFSVEGTKYRLTCVTKHHHHFLCIGCGRTSVLDECPLQLLEGKLDDFAILDHQFEIRGYCKGCQQTGQIPGQ